MPAHNLIRFTKIPHPLSLLQIPLRFQQLRKNFPDNSNIEPVPTRILNSDSLEEAGLCLAELSLFHESFPKRVPSLSVENTLYPTLKCSVIHLR